MTPRRFGAGQRSRRISRRGMPQHTTRARGEQAVSLFGFKGGDAARRCRQGVVSMYHSGET